MSILFVALTLGLAGTAPPAAQDGIELKKGEPGCD
jgi:hypothetical protein